MTERQRIQRREQKKRWREKHKAEILIKIVAWQKLNRDKVYTAATKFRKNNPELIAAHKRKRRAAKKGVEEKFTLEMRHRVFSQFNNQCFRCSSNSDLVLDHHIPLSAGMPLALGNAVILCRKCNSTKHSKMPKDFYSSQEMLSLSHYLQNQRSWNL